MNKAKLAKNLDAWMDGLVNSPNPFLPSAEVLVYHRGTLVHRGVQQGRAPRLASSDDAHVYRIFSMTKPIVSLALMLLYEEGKFQLSDPVWKWLGPAWKKENMTVCVAPVTTDRASLAGPPATVPCASSITVGQLFSHTAGLSHGFEVLPNFAANVVDNEYEKHGLGSGTTFGIRTSKRPATAAPTSTQAFCDRLASVPLVAQPGTLFHYSYSPELIGRLVEIISGQRLDVFLRERIFDPLGMRDTDFVVRPENADKFVGLWARHPSGKLTTNAPDKFDGGCQEKGRFHHRDANFDRLCGSAGLVSTSFDYMRFCACLLNGGRSPDTGKTIASPATIRAMTTINRLRKNGEPVTVKEFSLREKTGLDILPLSHTFGLGFAIDSGLESLCTPGSYYWSGAAGTQFWCDPVEEVAVVFMTAALGVDPKTDPIAHALHNIVYGALEPLEPTSRL